MRICKIDWVKLNQLKIWLNKNIFVTKIRNLEEKNNAGWFLLDKESKILKKFQNYKHENSYIRKHSPIYMKKMKLKKILFKIKFVSNII